MTCIVAIADGTHVVLAGDTAASGGKEIYPRADSKVFRVGPYAIGFTTSFRMGQILRYEAKLPDPPDGVADEKMEEFFVTEFVPVVRQTFKDHGYEKKATFPSTGKMDFSESGQEVGGLFVIGVQGGIFEIREDFHLARPATPYSSIGSGAPIAFGALHALAGAPSLTLRKRAETALEAAATYSSVVRGPFHFVEA
jgi:ATP-dependent protease HslVU (ClpYQ) peptidase subunit